LIPPVFPEVDPKSVESEESIAARTFCSVSPRTHPSPVGNSLNSISASSARITSSDANTASGAASSPGITTTFFFAT